MQLWGVKLHKNGQGKEVVPKVYRPGDGAALAGVIAGVLL